MRKPLFVTSVVLKRDREKLPFEDTVVLFTQTQGSALWSYNITSHLFCDSRLAVYMETQGGAPSKISTLKGGFTLLQLDSTRC